MAKQSTLKRLCFVLVGVALMALQVLAAETPRQPKCEYRGPSETLEGDGWHWSYTVGTKLAGSNRVNLSGAPRPDELRVVAEIQRDTAFNPVTKQESKESYCWFRTRLEIRTQQGTVLYADEWSTKFEDMPALLETHAVTSPADYFARFGHHTGGDFTSGVEAAKAADVELRHEAIAWSLEAQGIKGSEPDRIASELSRLKKVRTFTYRAAWREDLRISAYVPSLQRAVAVQVGY